MDKKQFILHYETLRPTVSPAFQGDAGNRGPLGQKGPKGAQGDRGNQGLQGAKGPPGKQVGYFLDIDEYLSICAFNFTYNLR